MCWVCNKLIFTFNIYILLWRYIWAYPGVSVLKESVCQCKRHGFDPWVGKISWRRKWQCTPVFLPRKSMDRGAWGATVHGVAKSQTQLSMHARMEIHCPSVKTLTKGEKKNIFSLSKSLSHVWLCDPMDYTIHVILQAMLEWVAFPFGKR